MRNNVTLRNGAMGIGISPQAEWKSGAPRNNDGVNLPTSIGHVPREDNFEVSNGPTQKARLVLAIATTQAGIDVIPGWYSFIDVKVGQWIWCVSRSGDVPVDNTPIGYKVIR